MAITGSVGKTTTKELTSLLLAGDRATHASPGNLNNHYGLPLALLLCDSPGMLHDRADAFAKLNVFAPRTWRHLTGPVRLTSDGEQIKLEVDMVVLATGIVPSEAGVEIELDQGLQRDEHGFITGDQALPGLLGAGRS